MSEYICMSCGDELHPAFIYGEWDDLCSSCYEEEKEQEEDESMKLSEGEK